jgi:hypothetical protein
MRRVVRHVADFSDRVDGSSVDVADLGTHDGRCMVLLQGTPQRRRTHPPLSVHVHLDNRRGAQAEETQRTVDRALTTLARNEPQRRRSA